MWSEFLLYDNIIYRWKKDNTMTSCNLLVLPKSCRKDIMTTMHDSKFAGHPGMSRMTTLISRKFYWPRMKHDIESWVSYCTTCYLNKRGPNQRKYPLLQEISGVPFQRVAFDTVSPLELTEMGNRYILVLLDYYTKWAEAYPIPNHKSEIVADAIVGQWKARHEVSLRLHCDNAQQFRSDILET